MKFLSAASTAALTCIFLLAPTALGDLVHKCVSGETFELEEAQDYASKATLDQVLPSDPVNPSAQISGAHHFTRKTRQNENGFYLVQYVGTLRLIQLYEYGQSGWEFCYLALRRSEPV
ncbi:BgTH12-04543 [Blumeria graminis f. sp. triticale]|uniref:BgtE-5685 n=3 Tax=Blumeria graminis TaxID=34373 RepID=A0A9X9L7X9_BLUGR|nr:putative secreted effector protein [Blumeria graminis f. sp. tritici 96224]CAD6498885.1 BgTH12-04543 [Blumeria graminis f. sp. triticale]VCU39004.1 BgtE-5685 [Blumeria graminis f. sp. tritici]